MFDAQVPTLFGEPVAKRRTAMDPAFDNSCGTERFCEMRENLFDNRIPGHNDAELLAFAEGKRSGR
ncbi:MAG: hypothetical protein CL418_10305 [Acidimicrobiaceae bacterium]|nr:hypothetical protein [Acidimicrobiaceae bacterium]